MDEILHEERYGRDLRVSKDDITLTFPKWIKFTAKVFGVEKEFQFNLTGDPIKIVLALIKFMKDRGCVDVRHRDFSRVEEYEEIGAKDGKLVTKKRTLPLYSAEQIAAMPTIVVDIADHAPKIGKGKRQITASQAVNAVGSMSKEDLKRLMDAAEAALLEK